MQKSPFLEQRLPLERIVGGAGCNRISKCKRLLQRFALRVQFSGPRPHFFLIFSALLSALVLLDVLLESPPVGQQ